MHTPEQIERWAREAGLSQAEANQWGAPCPGWYDCNVADLSRFAALVAQDERERAVNACEKIRKENLQSRTEDDISECIDAIRALAEQRT